MSNERPTVYLAGPITGCTYEEATDWRHGFTRKVGATVRCLSPMRGKAYLASLDSMPHTFNEVMSIQKAIVARDYFDTRRCDVMVANFLGAIEVVSIGTVIECAWAHAHGVPVLAVIEQEGNCHDHPMLRETWGWRVPSLDEAAAAIQIILVENV